MCASNIPVTQQPRTNTHAPWVPPAAAAGPLPQSGRLHCPDPGSRCIFPAQSKPKGRLATSCLGRGLLTSSRSLPRGLSPVAMLMDQMAATPHPSGTPRGVAGAAPRPVPPPQHQVSRHALHRGSGCQTAPAERRTGTPPAPHPVSLTQTTA